MLDSRWEQGSDFHWPWFEQAASPRSTPTTGHPWAARKNYYGAGRDALLHLLATHKWRRLWVPSYFCGEVLESIRMATNPVHSEVQILPYSCLPHQPVASFEKISFHAGDALLVVNLLGLQEAPREYPPEVFIVEDHTHDPWSDWAVQSKANFCIASLRKTLPLPDGAVLWSPRGASLPESPKVTSEHLRVVEARVAAMALKSSFLQGGSATKEQYRKLAMESEQALGTRNHISGMSWLSRVMLDSLPILSWRDIRRSNYSLLAGALSGNDSIHVLPPKQETGCPVGAILLCSSSEARDRLRDTLIANRIYPAILWTQSRNSRLEYDFSSRMLSIHCDYRYTRADMDRVTEVIFRELGRAT